MFSNLTEKRDCVKPLLAEVRVAVGKDSGHAFDRVIGNINRER